MEDQKNKRINTKTPSGAYLKKDEDHDVLGYPINPPSTRLPLRENEHFNLLVIDGYKFLTNAPGSLKDPQCATCLHVMGVLSNGEKIPGKVRELALVKDCDCPPQI